MPELLALREQATTALLDQLGRLDDAEPRWTWWPADQTVGFTRRMQTYEATMHRVDAELTAGLSIGTIAPDVAAGAVDHAVDVMWGWLPDGVDLRAPRRRRVRRVRCRQAVAGRGRGGIRQPPGGARDGGGTDGDGQCAGRRPRLVGVDAAGLGGDFGSAANQLRLWTLSSAAACSDAL